MQRRDFLAVPLVSLAAPLYDEELRTKLSSRRGEPFKLDYAPHFGMFRHHAGDDLIDQLQFFHDEGFRSLEDNGLMGRSVETQEKIGKKLESLNMRMGVFVAQADFGKVTFASPDPGMTEALVQAMKKAVEVAKRVGARWATVVPGRYDQRVERDFQFARTVDNLRRCAEICEPAGLTLVLEPLNPWRDHPGLLLTKIPQAYAICRAVNSPSVKILNDLYHQQITEGNLIPNLEVAYSEIAYFQVGDNPGRNEPGTGEINYQRVFGRIHALGFQGIVGMEHGNAKPGREGERAVIDAYRWADSF